MTTPAQAQPAQPAPQGPVFVRGPVGLAAGSKCHECPFADEGKPKHPVAGIGPPFKPDFIIIGEGPGMNETRQGVPFCLVPETLVLMSDLTWRRLGDVQIGDEIITVDEEPEIKPFRRSNRAKKGMSIGVSGVAMRSWRLATVTNRIDRVAPVFRVDTEQGSLTGTGDHRVMVGHGMEKHWRQIDQLEAGGHARSSKIVFTGAPWEASRSYAAAWLAGFFDGEGHVTGSKGGNCKAPHAGFSQNAGATEQRALGHLAEMGFEARRSAESRKGGVTCMHHKINGGFAETMRFLGTVRPERLVNDFLGVLRRRPVGARLGTFARVFTVDALNERHVIDITTTAGTFIANGFMVHNCGASGELMNKLLGEVGISRGRLYVTNASSCMPPMKSPEADRAKAIAACRPRLNAELAAYPGTPALVLGGYATRELTQTSTKLTKITQLAGTYHEVDLEGNGVPRALIPSLHPAFLLRSSGGGGSDKQSAKTAGGGHTATMGYVNLKFDVLKVKAIAAGRDIKLDMTRGVTRDWEIEDKKRANALVNELIQEVVADNFCAIDLETRVDDPARNFALQMIAAKIFLFSLSSKNHAVSVAWRLLTPATINNIRFVLASKTITKTYHNMVYEHGVLQNPTYRFVIAGPQEDTQLAHHATFPGNAHNLQAVACQFRGIPPWKAEFRDGDENEEEEADYSASDVFTTAKTIEPLHIWIQKTKTDRVYEIDRKKAAIAARMHLWGYNVDYDVNQELKHRLTSVIEASHEQLEASFEKHRQITLDRIAFERAKTKRLKDPDDFVERIAKRLAEEEKAMAKGKWDFSPGKDMHMVGLLKALGVSLTKQTEKGRTSMSAGTLEELVHVPEVAMLLRYRDNKTLFQTFVARMWEWVQDSQKKWRAPHVQDDGRVHPLWSPNKISGRFGSGDPPSQNVSRGDERNKILAKRLPNIRRQYTAPPGRRIVGFDLAQLEARLMALQSDDPFLCKVFAEGRDIHSEFATLIFPKFGEREKGSLEFNNERDMTKRLEYGGLYNGSDETVWRSIVVDFPEVTLAMTSAAIRKMKVMVGGVLKWQARLFQQVSQPPYELKSYILGRRRVFPMGNPPMTDVANNPNQFAGADVFDLGLAAMLACMARYPSRWNVMIFSIVHDAGYFEVPDDDRIVEQIGRDIRASWEQTFTSPSGIEINFPIDLKHGYAMHDDDPKLDEQIGMTGVGRPGLRKLKI